MFCGVVGSEELGAALSNSLEAVADRQTGSGSAAGEGRGGVAA
jgi:hypothetical protein